MSATSTALASAAYLLAGVVDVLAHCFSGDEGDVISRLLLLGRLLVGSVFVVAVVLLLVPRIMEFCFKGVPGQVTFQVAGCKLLVDPTVRALHAAVGLAHVRQDQGKELRQRKVAGLDVLHRLPQAEHLG